MANRYADRYAKLREEWQLRQPQKIAQTPPSFDFSGLPARNRQGANYAINPAKLDPIAVAGPQATGQVLGPLGQNFNYPSIGMGSGPSLPGNQSPENINAAQAAANSAIGQPSPFKETPGAFGPTIPGSVSGSPPVPNMAPGMISQELSPQGFGMGRLATPGTLAELRAKFKNREQGYGVRS